MNFHGLVPIFDNSKARCVLCDVLLITGSLVDGQSMAFRTGQRAKSRHYCTRCICKVNGTKGKERVRYHFTTDQLHDWLKRYRRGLYLKKQYDKSSEFGLSNS
jgi:hypothetical protein